MPRLREPEASQVHRVELDQRPSLQHVPLPLKLPSNAETREKAIEREVPHIGGKYAQTSKRCVHHNRKYHRSRKSDTVAPDAEEDGSTRPQPIMEIMVV